MVLSSYTVLFATATFGICTVSLLLLFVKSVYQLAQANMAITYEGILAQRTEELVRERIKVDNLLQRVLPEQTINELQQRGKVATERHGMVSVLFADIEGFTMIADSINPERLIDSLDRFFFNLDDITKRHDLEKIKTIGDAYMCAGEHRAGHQRRGRARQAFLRHLGLRGKPCEPHGVLRGSGAGQHILLHAHAR